MSDDYQEPIVKITPANGATCTREMRLDQAGKPVICGRKAGMVIHKNGTSLPVCPRHAKDLMDSIEATL